MENDPEYDPTPPAGERRRATLVRHREVQKLSEIRDELDLTYESESGSVAWE